MHETAGISTTSADIATTTATTATIARITTHRRYRYQVYTRNALPTTMAAEAPATPAVSFETPPVTRKKSKIFEQDASMRRNRAESSHRDVLSELTGVGVDDGA